MKVTLVSAELEENLSLRFMASALEYRGYQMEIIPFNSKYDYLHVVKQVTVFSPFEEFFACLKNEKNDLSVLQGIFWICGENSR